MKKLLEEGTSKDLNGDDKKDIVITDDDIFISLAFMRIIFWSVVATAASILGITML